MRETSQDQYGCGLAILQSNRMEDLKALLIDWLKRHPLPPFETETLLVQSNGMAQWLKLGFAEDQGLGISAGLEILLPSTFLWRAYRCVLGESSVPLESPLDLDPLIWRVFALLPTLVMEDLPLYAPLKRFLADDPTQLRRYQLSREIAALFDQYQVYRPDWLQAFSKNQPIRDLMIPDDLQWQAPLWRQLIAPLEAEGQILSRAFLNRQLIDALDPQTGCGVTRPHGLPRRLIIFGISSLPAQTLEALRALSQVCQVLYFVQNPCQYYWADLVDAREAAQLAMRTRLKRHRTEGAAAPESLHLEGNPLLAAWGKQGRDFVRLLDEWDDPTRYETWFQKIDLFEAVPEKQATLLEQIHNAILNRDPLPVSPLDRTLFSEADRSIQFHVAHTRQREVEVLHDLLLKLFDEPQAAGARVEPRDVIVMVPDIDGYAPHIEAVFGQMDPEDPRHIPFSLSDRRSRGQQPIHRAIEFLLELPERRFTAGEILDLLDVEAVQKRFGFRTSDLPLLKRWIVDAGIRWGLDGQNRAPLDPALDFAQNSWCFGLDRMALGYCMGNEGSLEDLSPLGDVGGLEAECLGPLWLMLEALSDTLSSVRHPAPATVWETRLRALIETFLEPASAEDRQSVEQLLLSLEEWLDHCASAELSDPLELSIVREAWLSRLDAPRLTQRFLAGRVNFSTLMPMRAIPFKIIALLGMNDGEFPRIQPRRVFDLMALKGAARPGDRSRRDDDRYLFLEALLSARQQLWVSWIGRHVRDDEHVPPSVLVSQLRDYIDQGWMLDPERSAAKTSVSSALTLTHGLQPFSPLYFRGDSPHFSYASEWRCETEMSARFRPEAPRLAMSVPGDPLTLRKLERFLKNPAEVFFEQRLGVHFKEENRIAEDLEPFELGPLDRYLMAQQLLKAALRHPGEEEAALCRASHQLRLSGSVPMAGAGELALGQLAERALLMSHRFRRILGRGFSDPVVAPVSVRLGPFPGAGHHAYTLEDWLSDLRVGTLEPTRYARIELRPAEVFSKGRLKRHALIGLWLRHLAAAALGVPLTSYLVTMDTCLRLDPTDPLEALPLLQTIVEGFEAGLMEPLPVAPKTAFAMLEANDGRSREALVRAYDGDAQQLGEVRLSDYLDRAYPNATDLLTGSAGGRGFTDWAEDLYQPLHEAPFIIEEALL